MVDLRPLIREFQDSAGQNTLNDGETLERNQSLVSQNGLFRLTMQQDGNVVLYGPTADPAKGPNSTTMWSSRTPGSDSQRLETEFDQLDTDIEGWTLPPPGDNDRNLQLCLEDDGNLVLYNLADNQPIWSSGTHEDIDPNKVTLVHPDGENDVVHEAVNAAQQAFQDSVDLFGTPGSSVSPPFNHHMLLLGPTYPDMADGNADTEPGSNEHFRYLIERERSIRDLIEEANSIAPKVEFVDDLNQSTLERIMAEIVFLNDAMRSARPPMDSNANNAGNYVHKSDKRRCYLTDSDTQAALRIIGDSMARVAEWVAECQRLNRKAAPTVAPPAPPSPTDPPAVARLGGRGWSHRSGSDQASRPPTDPAPPSSGPGDGDDSFAPTTAAAVITEHK